MNVHVQTAPAAAPPKRENRKAPRFKLPATLLIDGRGVEVVDWSTSGVGFMAPGADLEAGDRLTVVLSFAVGGAKLSSELDAEIRHFDRRTGRGGLSYEPAPGDAPSVPAFVIEEYLAGRILAMDGMLTKSDTLRIATPAAPAADGAGVFGRLRRWIGLGLVTIAGAFALYFLVSSAYERLFVFDAVSAQVAFQSVELDSPVAGTLAAVAQPGPVAKGTTIFRVVDAGGTATDMRSPCDCEVASGTRALGEYVGAGTTVLKLVDGSSAPEVLVGVAFPDVRRVYEGAAVDLKFLDGQWVRGARVLTIRSLDGQQSGLVTVEVDPGRALIATQFGEPVFARFDTAPWRRR